MSQTPNSNPRAGRRVSLSLDRSGGANQADGPGADINTIVAQYRRSGTLPLIQLSNPLYGDFTGPDNLHDAREAIQAATDRFMELPADVRSLAQNDPAIFLDMLDDETQRASLEAAGLQITNQPIPTTPPAPVAPPTPEQPNPPTTPTPSPEAPPASPATSTPT